MAAPPFPVPFAAVRGVLGLRRRALGAADLLLPGEAVLWDLAAGMQRTQLAGVLVSSGIADALGKDRRQPAELAAELGFDEEVTQRMLEAAAAARLARFDRKGRARLSRIGAPLRADHPHSVSDWVAVQASPANAQAYLALGEQLREGAEPSGFRHTFDRSFWDYLGDHPEEGERFDGAMRQLTEIDLAALTRAYPWPREGTICDVAGGVGLLLMAILERRPQSRGVLIDAPGVLIGARELIRSRKLEDRISCVPGDLTGAIEAEADVYVLKWVLHSWSDEACRGVLARLRETMPAGARVVVIDQHSTRGRPSSVTSMVDLHMLVTCDGGRERSPAEVHQLMQDVGLEPGRVRHSGVNMLVEATNPA